MYRDWVKREGSEKGNFWLDSALENRTIAGLTPFLVFPFLVFRDGCGAGLNAISLGLR